MYSNFSLANKIYNEHIFYKLKVHRCAIAVCDSQRNSNIYKYLTMVLESTQRKANNITKDL